MALWLALVRLHQRVGLAGVVGLGLLAAAALTAALAWREHRDFVRERAQQVEAPPSAGPVVSAPRSDVRTAPARWPTTGEVPVLLTRIERAAVEQGLGWAQADYRFNAATTDTPDSLEVKCTLKGPYPSIRAFVTALLLDMPTSTLREFSISRVSAEATNVDAKLSLVVYLDPDAGRGAEASR
jgi:hypothetical protein